MLPIKSADTATPMALAAEAGEADDIYHEEFKPSRYDNVW